MSNKKRISKKVSISKHYELKDLEKRNFFLCLENAHLRAQLAIIASQPYKTDYPSGAPDYLNKKNNYKIAGETAGPEILIGRTNQHDHYPIPKNAESLMWLESSPAVADFKNYEASWTEEFKNNPDHKKPFLKYLLDRFDVEAPIPDQFKNN